MEQQFIFVFFPAGKKSSIEKWANGHFCYQHFSVAASKKMGVSAVKRKLKNHLCQIHFQPPIPQNFQLLVALHIFPQNHFEERKSIFWPCLTM